MAGFRTRGCGRTSQSFCLATSTVQFHLVVIGHDSPGAVGRVRVAVVSPEVRRRDDGARRRHVLRGAVARRGLCNEAGFERRDIHRRNPSHRSREQRQLQLPLQKRSLNTPPPK